MAETVTRVLHPAIPRVMCPRCGAQMRLATIGPALAEPGLTEAFDCVCGFTYRHTVKPVRKPDQQKESAS